MTTELLGSILVGCSLHLLLTSSSSWEQERNLLATAAGQGSESPVACGASLPEQGQALGYSDCPE